jgi:hypothetical protein
MSNKIADIGSKATQVAVDAWYQGVRLDNEYEQLQAALGALYEEYKAEVAKIQGELH